jgi:hypothetical protein
MTLNHVHTYQRLNRLKGTFRCVDKYCTRVVHKSHLAGKACLCNICGQEFVLTIQDLRRSKPRCFNCSETKEAIAFRNRKKLLQEIGIQ